MAWFYQFGALRNYPQTENVGSEQKLENGMLVELRRRSGWRDRLFFACQGSVPTLIIFMTTVSCSRPEMPPPTPGILDQWFSGSVTEPGNTQLVQSDEEQPKIQRKQPGTTGSRKVAVVRAPNPAGTSVSHPAAKKASTPPAKKASTRPRPDAQKKEEQQLFQEFLEWRKRQGDLP